MPATVALILLAARSCRHCSSMANSMPVIVAMSARSLMAFALGLVAFLLIKVLGPRLLRPAGYPPVGEIWADRHGREHGDGC